MKKHFFGAMLAAISMAAGMFLPACVLFRDTADSVLDDYEDAIASNRTADKIETAEFRYEFGDGNRNGTMLIRFQDPGKVRIDVLDDERSMVFCLNKEVGWIYLLGDVIDMSAEDIQGMYAALLETIPFKVELQNIFCNARLQEETEFVCGEECDVIHARFRRHQDVAVKLWFGHDSDYLRQFEVNRDDGVHTIQYFDYREFGDVTLPAKMFRFSENGATKITLVSFEANTEIPEYVFLKPEKLSDLEGDER